MDLQLVVGSSGFSLLDDGLRCFWGNRQPTDPAWGGADPVFLSDDLAACKPEVIAMPPPPAGKDYEVFAHYYCDRRGHDELSGNVCYEPTEQLTTATATVNLYGNNVLLQTFSRSLALSDAWQVANLHRESNGTWTITPVDTVVTQAASDCVGNPACTCDQLGNPDDAYCGVGGAACRAMYP